MDREPVNPVRDLSNGVQITDERVVDRGDEISFEFELADTDFEKQFMQPRMLADQTGIGISNPPREVLDYLSDLYTAGSGNDCIVKGLREKGWVDADGTVIVQFTWKLTLDPDKKRISFIYTKSNTPYNRGFDMKS